ncbi:DUF6541 family protein [Arthrobacter agilis]|uniref:DUF6541 family protein n=1 Tax=Arthrobacter agilis TaxID=37921 RepID=UPI0027D915FE|nr:DUF6541 family protein [Arthrobacter agilis]
MLLVTVAVMVVPGVLLSLGLGFRRLIAVGLAPLFSVAVAGVAAVLGSLIGIRWSIWLVLGASVVFSAIAFVLTRRFGRLPRTEEPRPDGTGVLAAAGAGVVLGGALIAWRTVTLIGNPENIAQRFDNVFHLNAVEYIVSTGDGSSLTLGEMTGNTGAAAVYPAAWHSLAALVVQVTGTSVPIAVNALNIVIAAVVWPLSIVLLARIVAGKRPAVLLAAGVLSAAFIGFPYLMMVWGPLFPYMLSVALLPAAVGSVLLAVGMGRQVRAAVLPAVLAVLIAVAALGLSHMSTVNSLLLVSIPALAWALVRWPVTVSRIRTPLGAVILKSGIALAGLGLSVILWLKLRPVPYDVWGPHQTPGGAVGEVLSYSPMGFPLISLAVSVLGLVGIIHILRSGHHRWLLVSFALVGYLYVVDAGLERGPWRAVLTGIWYADTNRLAALLPLFGVLLGALGTGAAVTWLAGLRTAATKGDGTEERFLGGRRSARRVGYAAGLTVLALLLAVSTQTEPLETYLEGGEQFYLRDTPTSILSSDEYELLERADQSLPEDAVIAGNPWNGSTLAFAFTGRKVLSYHLFETQSPAAIEVSESLRDAATDPRACDAVEETGVSYVLDFGTQYLVEGGGEGLFPGFDDLADSDAVRLVDEQGAAKLYEVVVCQ